MSSGKNKLGSVAVTAEGLDAGVVAAYELGAGVAVGSTIWVPTGRDAGSP